MPFVPRRLNTAVWLGFMLAAFTITHLPPQDAGRPLFNDKLLHFIGYSMLGIVTVGWRSGRTASATRRRAVLEGFTLLAAYAMIDETTQPLIGRSCEWGDWLADLSGAALGVIAGSFFFRALPAKKS